eukprot:m.37681 g.37681  ORF g.37681 m.37681 type:complete len:358 (+) comp5458_c0_seq3:112-1185(+)
MVVLVFLAGFSACLTCIAVCIVRTLRSQPVPPPEGTDRTKYLTAVSKERHVYISKLPPPSLALLCGYDPTCSDNTARHDFEVVRLNTHCSFARTAVLWSAADWDDALSLEDNLQRSTRAFALFSALQHGVDGFLVAIPPAGVAAAAATVPATSTGARSACPPSDRTIMESCPHMARMSIKLRQCSTRAPADDAAEGGGDHVAAEGSVAALRAHAHVVARVLEFFSADDPVRPHRASRGAGGRGWAFHHAGVDMFVTTFSDCYPVNHARYAFGAHGSFVLFQPYSSFLLHDVGEESAHTNWTCPRTPREHIRAAFKRNGRPYAVPQSPAHTDSMCAVPGLQPATAVRWWADCDIIPVD